MGACCYASTEYNEGRAFAFHGGPSGQGRTARCRAESDQEFGYFGWSVGTAGDVNGDGRSDAIIGAPYFTIRDQEEGVAVAYYGRP